MQQPETNFGHQQHLYNHQEQLMWPQLPVQSMPSTQQHANLIVPPSAQQHVLQSFVPVTTAGPSSVPMHNIGRSTADNPSMLLGAPTSSYGQCAAAEWPAGLHPAASMQPVSSGLLQQVYQPQHPTNLQLHSAAPGSSNNSASTVAAGSNGAAARLSAKNKRSYRSSLDGSGVNKGLTKAGEASRRYRQRQQDLMSGLEAELMQKLQQLQLLAVENQVLRLRGTVLEAAVAGRDDVVRVTHAHGPPVYDASSSSAGSASSGGNTKGEDLQQQEEQVEIDTAATSDTCACSARIAPVRDKPLVADAAAHKVAVALPASTAPAKDAANAQEASGSLQEVTAADPASPQAVKSMSCDEILHSWRSLLDKLGSVLVALQGASSAVHADARITEGTGSSYAGGAGSSAAVHGGCSSSSSSSSAFEQLEELTERSKQLLETAMVLNPGAYCKLFGRNLDTGLPAVYDDEHWRQVLRQLDLSEQQVTHILAYAELYLPALHAVQQEQCALARQLLQPAATERSAGRNLLVSVMDPSTTLHIVLDALASNLRKQHVLRAMLCAFVCGELSILQRAKAAVHSHPLFLDVHALVCLLAHNRMAAELAAGQRPRYVFQHRWQHNTDLQGLVLPQLRGAAAAHAAA